MVETDIETLATKDKAELMKEQRELILDERAEFESRLTNMQKRHDHIERARREEERILLQLKFEESQEADKKAHAEHAETLKLQMKANRENDLKEKARFAKMSKAVSVFHERVMSGRREAHVGI